MRRGEDKFSGLVRSVSKNISAVKKAEFLSSTEALRSVRRHGLYCEPPRVAVTIIPRLAGPGCRVFPVEGRWELYFCFQETEDGITLGVIYDPKLFSPSYLKTLRTKFDHFHDASCREGTKLQDLVDWAPKHACLPTYPTANPVNPCRHVHHLFDAHAETLPDNIALHSAELGSSMTYGQLYVSTEQKAMRK